MGLEVHASVFAILLPFDEHIFKRLLETRAPAWVARYVTECFRAEPEVFAATAGDLGKMQGVIDAFWGRFAAGSGNILNMANILAHLPYDLRALILARAQPDRVATWVSNSEPRDGVNLLASLRDAIIQRSPALNALRVATVQGLRNRIKHSGPEALHEIPLRLTRFKLAEDSSGVEVLAEVLDATTGAVAGTPNWKAVQRILWDSYVFCPPLQMKVVAATSVILTNHGRRLPFWTRLCLAGLLDLADQPRSHFDRDDIDEAAFVRSATDPAVDRWQRFVASLAYWLECRSYNMQFPSEALLVLAPLYGATRGTHPGPSADLLDRVGQFLGVGGGTTLA